MLLISSINTPTTAATTANSFVVHTLQKCSDTNAIEATLDNNINLKLSVNKGNITNAKFNTPSKKVGNKYNKNTNNKLSTLTFDISHKIPNDGYIELELP